MTGVRARVRAELTNEIKAIARRQIATDGAANLSLRAIARELGMVSSAIYRYFPGRDELLTALIVDGYDTFGRVAEAADALVERPDVEGRWRAVGLAAYRWARENTSEYALLFGTPVPGYVAPADTIDPAGRFTNVLLAMLADAQPPLPPSSRRGSRRSAAPRPASSATVAGPSAMAAAGMRPATLREMRRLAARVGPGIDERSLFLGLHAWSSLIGTIGFILFGHLHTVVEDEDAFFESVLTHLGRQVFPATRE